MKTDSSKNNTLKKSVYSLIKSHWQQPAILAFFAGMLLFIFLSGICSDEPQSDFKYIEPFTPTLTDSDPTNSGDSGSSPENGSCVEIQYPLDLNKATYEQLCGIKGIGEVTARAIIDFRNEHGIITSLEQLTEISGIGENTVELLSQYLYISEEDYIPYDLSTIPDPTAAQTKPPTETTTPERTKTEKSSRTKTVTQPQTETEPPQTSPPETETFQFSDPASDPQGEPVRRPVNINTASAEEIAKCLLLPLEKAQDIVDIREQISYYSAVSELFLVDSLTEEEIYEIADYVLL